MSMVSASIDRLRREVIVIIVVIIMFGIFFFYFGQKGTHLIVKYLYIRIKVVSIGSLETQKH